MKLEKIQEGDLSLLGVSDLRRIDDIASSSGTSDDPTNGSVDDVHPSSSTSKAQELFNNNNIVESVFNILSNFHWSKSGKVNYSQKYGHLDGSKKTSIVCKEPLSSRITFNDLPENVIMEIFSYLDVASLCRVAQVCERTFNVANDNLLWERKLKQDTQLWEVIGHLSFPKLHIETNPDLPYKEIYLRCCPECRLKQEYQVKVKRQIPNLKFYFGFSVPKVVMFGSGLNNSGFVKSLLWDKKSPFTVKEMFPGEFEGTGSGFTLQYNGGYLMDLITLYGMSKADREAQDGKDRKSKLLVGDEEEQEEQLTLSQPLRELCSTVDAFIYVVNGSDTITVNKGKEEFEAMLDPRWVKPNVPVLILSLLQNSSTKGVPSIEVAEELDLLNLTRPWQVRQFHVDTLYGLLPGVNWFTKRIMNTR